MLGELAQKGIEPVATATRKPTDSAAACWLRTRRSESEANEKAEEEYKKYNCVIRRD